VVDLDGVPNVAEAANMRKALTVGQLLVETFLDHHPKLEICRISARSTKCSL
jgi:hypothetical protein